MGRRVFVGIILSLALYLAGNGRVALWDRDEPRYAQCSRQMLQSGDWVVPRLYDQVRYAKPPLTYWCQATCMKIFGDDTFAARLPSSIAMTATLAVVYVAVRRGAGKKRAAWTAFILGTSALAIAAAKMCLTDSLLLLFITISQLSLYAFIRGRRAWANVALYAIATGLAGLTKGPVVLGVQGMTLAAYWLLTRYSRHPDRSEGSRTPAIRQIALSGLIAISIIAAIVLPWIVLVEQRSPGFIMHSLRHDVVERMQSGLEGHKGPPGYYLVTVWASYFPWSLLIPGTLILAWKRRHLPQVRFAIAAIAGPWLMFELVQTKLPHYILPTFPALAFLTADILLLAIRRRHQAFSDRGFVIAVSIWSVVIAALGFAPWLATRHFEIPIVATVIVSAAAVAYVACVFALFAQRRVRPAAMALGAGFAVLVVLMYTIYLPRADYLRLSPRIAASMIDRSATTPDQEVMIDYKEPSLAFHQGGTLREKRDDFLKATPIDQWPQWIVLTRGIWTALPPDKQSHLDIVNSFRGLSYADGNGAIEVLLARKR